MGTGSTQISRSNAMSLHRVISKTHPPTSLPKSSRESWVAAASCCQGPLQGPKTAKPCSLLSPATQDIHAQSTAHGTQCWPPKCPIQLVTHSHPRTLWHPLPLEKHSRCCLTPGHLWLPQAHSKLWVALQEGFDPSCSRSHGKLHLSGKTLGQITAAHTRWGDTMHS